MGRAARAPARPPRQFQLTAAVGQAHHGSKAGRRRWLRSGRFRRDRVWSDVCGGLHSGEGRDVHSDARRVIDIRGLVRGMHRRITELLVDDLGGCDGRRGVPEEARVAERASRRWRNGQESSRQRELWPQVQREAGAGSRHPDCDSLNRVALRPLAGGLPGDQADLPCDARRGPQRNRNRGVRQEALVTSRDRLALAHGRFLDHHALRRLLCRRVAELADLLDHVHAARHLPEQGVVGR